MRRWRQPVRDAADRRRARLRTGRISEVIAAAWLILKGYRVLAWNYRSRLGEIDLIAVRGRRLAFVEVKHRSALDDAAAAISDRQAKRIADAAEQWVWRRPAFRTYEIGLDAILLAPRSLPFHAPNALQPS